MSLITKGQDEVRDLVSETVKLEDDNKRKDDYKKVKKSLGQASCKKRSIHPLTKRKYTNWSTRKYNNNSSSEEDSDDSNDGEFSNDYDDIVHKSRRIFLERTAKKSLSN